MIGLLLTVAVLAAVVAFGLRRAQRLREARHRPGATIARAVVVRRFDEIDAGLADHTCRCGSRMRLLGESSTIRGARRFRVARLRCTECEREERMYFDVTAVFH
jgi:hypothetical protein